MSRFRVVMWVALLAVSLVRCTVPSLEDLWRERGFCAVGDAECGMLRVRVDATGFVPGCVRFVAKDDASEETRTVSVPYRGTAQQGKTLTQGFSPLKTWSLAVSVSVEAFEQTCEGTAVTTQRRQSTLREGGVSELAFALVATDADGDGYVGTATGGTDCRDTVATVNPGATELCNGEDDNCNSVSDDGLGLGEACTTGEGCTGVRSCGENAAVICVAPFVQYAWADEDLDGHGDVKQGQVPVCTAQLPLNRLPLSAPHDDCDDSRGNVKPGAVEVCNGLDDNCVGGSDEGFNVGGTCLNAQTQCFGSIQCNESGTGSRCQLPSPAPTWYPDDDNDSHGQADAGVVSCVQPGSGFVLQGADCDDGNRFIFFSAPELCDEQDNNCNGVTDEGACTGGPPGWITQSIGGPGTDWLNVATYGDGGVWIVGSDSARAVKVPGSSGFNILPGKCADGTSTQNLGGVWAHPQTGVAYIGHDEGGLIVQEPSSSYCGPRTYLLEGKADVTGLQGFVRAGQGVEIHGVTSEWSGPRGAMFTWDGGASSIGPSQVTDAGPLKDINGVSPDVMFAVGGQNSSVILRYSPSQRGWLKEPSVPTTGRLNAVHVVSPRLAYAVGEDGTLLTWNGVTWSVAAGTPGVSDNFTEVLAFGRNSIYIVSEQGVIYRYNGSEWRTVSPGYSLYGIHGSSPEDIWVVGRFGRVFRYPYWPQ
ncbi:hypothetical protein D7V97_06175 [Corallococcus sp. CA053C]|uniref:putative metal-binding motif-containing protein n=1 Tax=Corallococcus sp. CA053C TaxID=2316732 RepID=UPI000EA38880|nr:putative metal-binding motif-containing protein [Corallococcus sp. CA053C]RKH13238.1 hypothetical protein D7V97_06175 [Corallococcus sp. CA053C]